MTETESESKTDGRTGADARPPTLLQVAGSVLASFFGVQTSRNRERDFQRGKPHQFIIVGLVMTALFVLLVWGVVQLVLGLALPG